MKTKKREMSYSIDNESILKTKQAKTKPSFPLRILLILLVLLATLSICSCSRFTEAPELMKEFQGTKFTATCYTLYTGKTLTTDITLTFKDNTVIYKIDDDWHMSYSQEWRGDYYWTGDHYRESRENEYNYTTVSKDSHNYIVIYKGDDPNDDENLVARFQLSIFGYNSFTVDSRHEKSDLTYIGLMFDDPAILKFKKK